MLSDPVDSFWVTGGVDYEGKPFKSVSQGQSDLGLIPLAEGSAAPDAASDAVGAFIAYARETLGDAVSDVRASDRLTDSASCLVASDHAMDRQLEKILASSGRLDASTKPVLEINPNHPLVARLSDEGGVDAALKEDAAHLLLDEARIADGELPVDLRGVLRAVRPGDAQGDGVSSGRANPFTSRAHDRSR